ncbi:MAG TPA: DUF429 domain-containing protein [Acidimicrobiales bacterium]|nr:DUF429 domain-containing protein [Acidimicrobiales bacterium]
MMSNQRGARLPYRLLAGVVPCPAGWLVARAKLQGITISPEEPFTVHSFVEVLDYKPAHQVIALAAPVGLPDDPAPGGRTCDRQARHLVGWPRCGAITSAPSRSDLQALSDGTEVHVSAVSRQMAGRVAEVDRALSPYWQRTVFEVHPELSFHQLNEDRPLSAPKHGPEGLAERRALLEHRMAGVSRILDAHLPGVDKAHLADGAVCLWTARRVAARAVTRLPDMPEWDSKGLRMEIVR